MLGMATLREIQARNRGNSDIRALLVEIKRMHEVIVRAELNRQVIDRVWKADVGGQLVALHEMRVLLMDEPCVREMAARP